MITENLIVFLVSCGSFGMFALLLCYLAAYRSKRHPAFGWWFWRLGAVPVAASAYAVYIGLTPREQIEGSSVNYGRLDFFAMLSWGLLIPMLYLAIAAIGLFALSFRRGDNE
jgi:1-acyl-sn-glycerol-3-phosphate acyltransferase